MSRTRIARHLPSHFGLRTQRHWGLWSRLALLGIAVALFSMSGCFLRPPDMPDLEFPPCLQSANPSNGAQGVDYAKPTFNLRFSSELEPSTVSSTNIALIPGEADYYFLSDLESPPVSSSRQALLVPLQIKITSQEGKPTEVSVTPAVALRGDSVYTLVLTRKIRDRLRDLGENRRTGSRPLNVCPDENDNWSGDIETYKRGRSEIITFKTKSEPPRGGIPRIVEVMASPPSSAANGEYVEIYNADTKPLDLCGLLLGDTSTSAPREIIALQGNCTKIGPKQRGVIIEPDYSMQANPYKIPPGTPMFTTKSTSGSTLLSGGISGGEGIVLYQAADTIARVDPNTVAGGSWPSGKSSEKCDPNGANTATNWKESESTTAGGTPGKGPSGCP